MNKKEVLYPASDEGKLGFCEKLTSLIQEHLADGIPKKEIEKALKDATKSLKMDRSSAGR